jgi:hypothetical protein
VKQRRESNQFIAINEKVKMDAGFFYIKQLKRGRESKTADRQKERERECERQSIAEVKDSIFN